MTVLIYDCHSRANVFPPNCTTLGCCVCYVCFLSVLNQQQGDIISGISDWSCVVSSTIERTWERGCWQCGLLPCVISFFSPWMMTQTDRI